VSVLLQPIEDAETFGKRLGASGFPGVTTAHSLISVMAKSNCHCVPA
jgi:hypothetical protein